MAKRVFFVINLPKEVRETLGAVTMALAQKQQHRAVRWVLPENLHITLHFLGNRTEDELIKLNVLAREAAADVKSFTLRTKNIGCFPNEGRPRVIMVETTEETGTVRALEKKLGSGLQKFGFKVDQRPWHSHITLGRVKNGAGACDINVPVPALTIPARSFELMESESGSDGSRYRVLASYPFSAK